MSAAGATRELVLRAACLYVPLAVAVLAGWWRRPDRKVAAGAIVATAWAMATLLALNKLATTVGWWRFDVDGGAIAQMPVDVWIGWALLWGCLPVMVDPSGRWSAPIVSALVAFDLAAMPLLEPVVVLGPRWLIGEVVGVAAVLVPAVLLGRWTSRGEQLGRRLWLQIGAFTGLVFFVIPEIVFSATTKSTVAWSPVLDRPRWHFVAFALAMLPFVALALQAVREFAVVGRGTPLPLDPPQRLVTSGPYAYVANPMQLSGTVLLIAWGAFLSSWIVMAAGAMAAVFSAGLAALNEHRDLAARFGPAWIEYRRSVRLWLPRWRPVACPATLDVAATCDPCREVGMFFARRSDVALEQRGTSRGVV